MAKIPIKCHECGHSAKVPVNFAGKRVRCLHCQTKLRVPQATAGASSTGGRSSRGREGAGRGRSASASPPRERRRDSASANRRRGTGPGGAGISSEARRRAQAAIREILEEYEFAIESDERGFLVDIRGVTFGLARTLVEEILADTPGVRDVRLAGGIGECRLTVILKGASFNADDSFADEDDETEIFQRKGIPERQDIDLDAIVANATGDRLANDPVKAMMAEADRHGDVMDSMRPVVPDGSTRGPSAPASVDDLVTRGQQLLDQGELEQAIKVLERAVRMEKDNPDAVDAVARAYAAIGEFDRARRAFRHLSKLRPKDVESMVMHAAAAVRCDRLEDARNALVAAIRLDPSYPRAYRYASELYKRLGDPVKAQQFKQRYRQLKGS